MFSITEALSILTEKPPRMPLPKPPRPCAARWARVSEFEMVLDGKKITEYRATARIYFEIER
ncbi:MAG TPA: dodecin domain-containing protein [Candidatus Acidoferrum sp.]|jgi:hypothetical protein|nr:dodecin domain-containing protein [Candidatus Acidoferrum sp.]